MHFFWGKVSIFISLLLLFVVMFLIVFHLLFFTSHCFLNKQPKKNSRTLPRISVLIVKLSWIKTISITISSRIEKVWRLRNYRFSRCQAKELRNFSYLLGNVWLRINFHHFASSFLMSLRLFMCVWCFLCATFKLMNPLRHLILWNLFLFVFLLSVVFIRFNFSIKLSFDS